MVSQCVNPDCGMPFIYLRNGRLLAVPRKGASMTSATVEYFWLCERCAQTMRPDFDSGEFHFTLITENSGNGHHHR
jgi:hypothetical protein